MKALVTGATGDIGWQVQHALRKLGAVAVTYRGGIPLSVQDTPCVPWDLDHGVQSLVEGVELAASGWMGPFDAIVHCAGSELVAPLGRTTDEQLDRVFGAARGCMAILKAAAKGAVADGGAIVMMSSVAAHRGWRGMAAYSGTKAFIEAACRAAAVELAPRRIRVNCVAAGAVDSRMHQRLLRGMSAEGRRHYEAQHPLGFGKPEHVADAILALLRNEWQTGTTVVVDGGLLAGPGAP